MRREIKFDIECGETTCASEPGKFCRFCKWKLNGDGTCYFFGKLFEDENGCLARHKDCIAMAEEVA